MEPMKKILTFGTYLKRRFGRPVRKVPLSIAGFTCPNIDGKVAKGGCTYCENESFSPNLAGEKGKFFLRDDSPENPLLERQLAQVAAQYRQTAARLRETTGARAFLAYFQSFTNTYAPAATLEPLYRKALSMKGCVGLSVGTRGDSVNDAVLDLLAELSREHEVWVEYGVQSVFDDTLKAINRGEVFEQVKEAILRSKKRGLKVCAHLIFGLPGETQEMMLKSVEETLLLGVDSIKIHPLYVTRNTALAAEFLKGKFVPIEKDVYIETLVKAMKMLPEHVSVQRITAGIDSDSLLGPAWCREKNRLTGEIRNALRKEGMAY